MIRMTHPTLPDDQIALATEQAFELVWKRRGWELAPEEDPDLAPAPEPRVKRTPTTKAAAAKNEEK